MRLSSIAGAGVLARSMGRLERLWKTGAGVTALVILGGGSASFLPLALLSLAGPFIVPATLVVYGPVYGLILPFVLFVVAVGILSWRGIKTRWRNMHRWSYRW